MYKGEAKNEEIKGFEEILSYELRVTKFEFAANMCVSARFALRQEMMRIWQVGKADAVVHCIRVYDGAHWMHGLEEEG